MDIQYNSVTSIIYNKLPDGSPIDYNRIFDIVDKQLENNKKKIKYVKAERYMYQYKDAEKTNDVIWDRYDYITTQLGYDDEMFMKNPTRRMVIAEANIAESSSIEALLFPSEMECYNAKQAVKQMISKLVKVDQRLVMTAHYLCGAEWKWISCVYAHKLSWAKDVHDKAMKVINGLMTETQRPSLSDEDDDKIEILIQLWEDDEAAYMQRLREPKPKIQVDERKMALGMY